MEYVNNIYPCTCIRIMTFYITRIMSYIYMSFRHQQLIVKAYRVFLIILYFYMILYDTCILLCHIYEKNNIRAA